MQSNIVQKAALVAFGLFTLGVAGAGCQAGTDTTAAGEEDGAELESGVGSPLCLSSASGAYCGNDMMSGASAGTLYQCPGANKAPTSSTPCASGCVVAPQGQADYCASGPVCLSSSSGAYCGNDMMSGASASTLYQCAGANKAPTSATPCANGCVVAPQGQADYCKAGGASPGSYRLPWHTGTSMQLTQDCNDSCCADHVGTDAYAWDFANGASFDVRAARAGTVTHVKMNSQTGCGSSSCVNYANYIVIDHGDGTQSTYLHLAGGTLDPSIACGGYVQQGQHLAWAGSTGWSSGTHLHYQVSKSHPGAQTCECGSTGQACSAGTVAWGNFWVSATYPSVAIGFDEWPSASQCANRRQGMPGSLN